MSLTFRKSHPHIDDAYQVIHEGIAVGSITKRGDEWAWEIYLFGRVVPGNSGRSSSGNQATADFRAAWDRSVTPADLDWIRQRT